MIVLDIETSGLYPEKHGIWQIGALDLYNFTNTFIEESRIDYKDLVAEEALRVIGKTESHLRDPNKQSQKKLLENFFSWTETADIKNALCQNPQFDIGFINFKARKYELTPSFHHRSFDLHSIAQTRYQQLYRNLLIKDNYSDMGLSNILQFCGLEDKRISMEKGKVKKEGTPHNALEDAKLTAECFSRLIYGRSLLEKFSQYKVPEYLTE